MTARSRAAVPAVAFAFLVAYLFLVIYVATTGDPFATVVADVALATGVVAFGLLLFVRPTDATAGGRSRAKRRTATAATVPTAVGLADATAATLVTAGFVRFLALVTDSAVYRVGAELLLAAAFGLVVAGWLRRRRANGDADGTGRRRGRSRGRTS